MSSPTSIKFPDELLVQIEARSAEIGVNRSQFIIEAVEARLSGPGQATDPLWESLDSIFRTWVDEQAEARGLSRSEIIAILIRRGMLGNPAKDRPKGYTATEIPPVAGTREPRTPPRAGDPKCPHAYPSPANPKLCAACGEPRK